MILRIPLIVFTVASVIGVMAVTTIAAISMQKAYSQTSEMSEWCFKHNGQDRCFSSPSKCHQEASAAAPEEKKDEVPPCQKAESSHIPHDPT